RDGMTGHAAARAAEDPVRCPPAGPVTDPAFDNEVLAPILQEVHEATLAAAAHAEQRWLSDRWSFTSQVAWIREGGAPQARRDGAVAAAKRLARLEREQQRLAGARAAADPLF